MAMVIAIEPIASSHVIAIQWFRVFVSNPVVAIPTSFLHRLETSVDSAATFVTIVAVAVLAACEPSTCQSIDGLNSACQALRKDHSR